MSATCGLRWRQQTWAPGLDDGERTLGSVYESMPADPASEVPWYVRLLENPSSPLALPGAIDLFGHDCIHILLGRGLLAQDEAFVLGFTMGASGRCAPWQAALFRFCSRHVYQGAFRFSELDRQVFSLALEGALDAQVAPLEQVDFHAWLERPLGELRAALGVRPVQLRALYAREARCFPHTAASRRLPLSTREGNPCPKIWYRY